MHLKSFYARDVKTALALARRELGPEAMLLDSRKAPPEAQHLGECEVVMAVGLDTPGPEISVPAAPVSTPAPPAAAYASLASEVAELRKHMQRLATNVTRSFVASAHVFSDPELMSAFAELLESDLDSDLAHSVLTRVRMEGVPAGRDRIRMAMAAELAGRFQTCDTLGTQTGRRIVAFVGPCGAGKTTTLVKLAARHGLSTRRPAQILSIDGYRVAAGEALRSYSAILGIGYQSVESTRALAQHLEETRNKDLVFIDTPGFGPRDLDAAADLGAFLGSRTDIDVHLVLTASMRSADLSRMVDRFAIFSPRKLVFTRLDETASYGPLINEAVRSGKPVSFLAGGQRVPEDLEPATKDRIIELVLNRT